MKKKLHTAKMNSKSCIVKPGVWKRVLVAIAMLAAAVGLMMALGEYS